ncbi:MAG: N-6 DNA methylase [Saprospiraceae bacterium]|nr:N-6 DNA methylase [Saprospiraceae bacterium]
MTEKLIELKKLCEHFENSIIKGNKKLTYDEANTKIQFINKFFSLLDWDIDNSQLKPDEYKDVELETPVNVDDDRPKKPDYSFKIGKEIKFFVEAKKPSVNIKDTRPPAYQLRRYGNSGQVVLSILTDFEEFAVYDTRIVPNQNDNANVARILYFRFEDYEKSFKQIYNLFSKPAILDGSLDKYAKDSKNKKGTSRFDKDFLSLIEKWRELLATNIAINNQELDVYSLNDAVQVIIDRIIFLRFAEDKNVEKYGLLKDSLSTENIYTDLNKIFLKAHNKYNSGLFEKIKWISDLKINNDVFKTILQSSYFPECPYEFSIMPIEILGNIYEQLLGKVIHIKPSHEIEIEEKEEVKKAGGVVYTPQYIVKYIVENTVGEKIKKADLANLKLTVLDSACGSGSFLVGVYSFLLEKYLSYYTEKTRLDKSLKSGFIYLVSKNKYLLSLKVKQNILLKHIYGVDIDKQAVEVTKLSLLLKLMEDETTESADKLFKHNYEKLLPDLDNNIKCGNSLVDSIFYEEQDKQASLFTEEKIRKVNKFDWIEKFPEIFKDGGFDIIVGNPPYVRQEILGEDFKKYAKSHYKNTFSGTADLYVYFIEKSLSILKKDGLYSIIVANKWMRANYGESLRKFLKTKRIIEIIDFGDLPVFTTATTYPCIIKVNNDKPKDFRAIQVKDLDFTSLKDVVKKESYSVDVDSLEDKGWSLSKNKESALLDKIKKVGIPLGEYVDGKIFYGIKTGLNEAFVVDEETKNRLIKEDPKSKEVIKPFLEGKDIKRYATLLNKKWLILFEKGFTNKKKTDNKKYKIESNYPAIFNYLNEFQKKAEARYDQGDYWWELRACEYYKEFEKEKIVFPDISTRGNFTIDLNKSYLVNTSYIIPLNDLYVLAILNSKITTWVYSKLTSTIRGGYLRWIYQYVAEIPIPNNPDLKIKTEIISLVEQILSTQKEISINKNESTKQVLEEKCNILETKLDKLVYELYGLDEKDIDIIKEVLK